MSYLDLRGEHDQHVRLCLGAAAVPLIPLLWLLRSGGGADSVLALLAIPIAGFFTWGALQQLRRTWPVAALERDPLAIGWVVDDGTWWRFWAMEAREAPFGTFVRWWPAVVVAWLVGGCSLGVVGVAAVLVGRVVWHVRGALAVGRKVELRGDTLHIGGVPHRVRSRGPVLLLASVDRLRDPAALELVVPLPGGAGMSETVRAPVPAEHLTDADVLVAWLSADAAPG